jgi:hypothetical protein
MLTPELVEHRALTLMEALFSADKRQRGHVNYDKVLQVYSLFLHGATGTLHEEELGDFVAQCTALSFGPPALQTVSAHRS